MSLLRALYHLKAPFVALAFCALLAQQMVGFVLTASPVMAYESGFSLCLSGPPPSSDDPRDGVGGSNFCPCTMQHVAAVLPNHYAAERLGQLSAGRILPQTQTDGDTGLASGPPPARAPPFHLHTA